MQSIRFETPKATEPEVTTRVQTVSKAGIGKGYGDGDNDKTFETTSDACCPGRSISGEAPTATEHVPSNARL